MATRRRDSLVPRAPGNEQQPSSSSDVLKGAHLVPHTIRKRSHKTQIGVCLSNRCTHLLLSFPPSSSPSFLIPTLVVLPECQFHYEPHNTHAVACWLLARGHTTRGTRHDAPPPSKSSPRRALEDQPTCRTPTVHASSHRQHSALRVESAIHHSCFIPQFASSAISQIHSPILRNEVLRLCRRCPRRALGLHRVRRQVRPD